MIDTDVFQVLTLALLFLMLIALLAALSSLNGIKKSLSEGAPRESPYTPPASSYAEPAAAYEPQTAYSGSGSYPGAYGAEPAATPEPAAQEVATGYVPLSQATAPEPTPEPTPQTTTTAASAATDPEEQPFERDGRWWFKRGDELLVYDEGTGQWVAAGEQPGAAPAAVTTADTSSVPVTSGEAGEGWRCSSCGAINGSTATVCRMCFTPR